MQLKNKIKLAVTSLVASALAVGFPASAEETKGFSFGIEGNNTVFSSLEQATAGGLIRLAVKDGSRATIVVELVDIFANEQGAKRALPLTSSPFTPNNLVSFQENLPEYSPSPNFQYFDIAFRFKKDILIDRPVLGGLRISLASKDLETKELKVESSIVATFAYLPEGKIDSLLYKPALEIRNLKVSPIAQDPFPLNLIPDLPWIQNSGKIQASFQLENTGEIFLESTTNLKAKQLFPFQDKDPAARSTSLKLFLVPNQSAQENAILKPTAKKQSELGIGLYSLETKAQGSLGQSLEVSETNQQLVLIFPWKQALLILLLLVLLRNQIAKGIYWLVDYGKAFGEFRIERQRRKKKRARGK